MKMQCASLIVMIVVALPVGCASGNFNPTFSQVQEDAEHHDDRKMQSRDRVILPENRAIEAQGHLAHIVKAYQTFRYEDVIRLAEHLITHDEATHEVLVNALVWAGAASYLMGNTPQACDYFREALMLNPQIALNKQVFPSAIIALLQKAKNEHGSVKE